MENKDNSTLNCTPATVDTVTGYEWYKADVKIHAGNVSTYALPDNTRNNSGVYTCKVVTASAPLSVKADTTTITFLCKFSCVICQNNFRW